MGAFLAMIMPLLIGAVPAITRELAQAKADVAKSTTERERIGAEERVKSLEARRDVLVAESGTPWNTVTRFLLTTPFILYLWKVVAIDKVLCHTCKTDPLSPWLEGILGIMLAFYFVADITRIIKR